MRAATRCLPVAEAAQRAAELPPEPLAKFPLLSDNARAVWDTLITQREAKEWRDCDLVNLAHACNSMATVMHAQETIAFEGAWYCNRKGDMAPHPAVGVARTHIDFFYRASRALGLIQADMDTEDMRRTARRVREFVGKIGDAASDPMLAMKGSDE